MIYSSLAAWTPIIHLHSKLCTSKLCIYKLCTYKLCIYKLCIYKLCIYNLYYRTKTWEDVLGDIVINKYEKFNPAIDKILRECGTFPVAKMRSELNDYRSCVIKARMLFLGILRNNPAPPPSLSAARAPLPASPAPLPASLAPLPASPKGGRASRKRKADSEDEEDPPAPTPVHERKAERTHQESKQAPGPHLWRYASESEDEEDSEDEEENEEEEEGDEEKDTRKTWTKKELLNMFQSRCVQDGGLPQGDAWVRFRRKFPGTDEKKQSAFFQRYGRFKRELQNPTRDAYCENCQCPRCDSKHQHEPFQPKKRAKKE